MFALAVLIYYPFSPGGRQQANMRLAEQHVAKILPQIQFDPRFRSVRLGPFTGNGGGLYVGGEVQGPAELTALRQIIDRSTPPVYVFFHVTPRDVYADTSALVSQPATQASIMTKHNP